MMARSFSSRALIAALLPTAAVAILLAGIFNFGRIEDLEDAHRQRASALVRQLATSSRFALFVGDRKGLQTMAEAMLAQADVTAVSIFDANDERLVMVGSPSAGLRTLLTDENVREIVLPDGDMRLTQAVTFDTIQIDDFYVPGGESPAWRPLGYVELEVSHAAQSRRVDRLLLASGLITLAGLVFGAYLAARLTRRVIAPIREITGVVERIGQGDLQARVRADASGSTQALGEGVNRMAEHIGDAQQDLQRRIAEATRELQKRTDEAEEATRYKSRFLAAASHDLRQPLHALGMFVARLRQLRHPPEVSSLVDNVDRSVDALAGLLNSLLDISRLDAGVLTPKLRSFPVSRLLQRLATDLAPKAEEKGLALRIRPSGLWVNSDPEWLYRIILNLGDNAVTYTRRGAVLIACRLRAGSVRLEVWDTGIGIAEANRQEIFKEFVQIQDSERDSHRGLGLGLAIVERTARLLDLPVGMCSRVGIGTCFSICVPLAQQPDRAGGERVAWNDSGDPALAEISVLLIDDDELSRRATAAMIESWGCSVIACSGLEDVPPTGVPDVIVSDFRLAGASNGIDAIALLRSRYGAIVPACLISGDTDDALTRMAAARDLPLLRKPIRAARLMAAIRRLASR
jgi:two-component system, sensor histidine kinase